MASRSTSFFTNCLSAVSPLQKTSGVLDPIEKAIAGFFVELKQRRPVSIEKIEINRKILSDFISDELLLADDQEHLMQCAKQLENKLIAVEYFMQHYSAEALNAYLRLLKINEKPFDLRKSAPLEKFSSTQQSINTELCQEFLKTVQTKLHVFHQELKPLEVQTPLSMVMPQFEEKEDVYSYVDPFLQRADRAIRLNEIKEELKSLEAGLHAYVGVQDSNLRRLHDQCTQGLSSLLKRVTTLRADFGRQPLSLKKAISAPVDPTFSVPEAKVPAEFFSKKPGNLTLS